MTTTAAPVESPAGFTHRQILTILSGLMLGMLLASLDQTIVSTSIRTIADDLHGYSLQAWATTAYLITATISTPLYGKLSRARSVTGWAESCCSSVVSCSSASPRWSRRPRAARPS
ncbi:hypothetical protein [Amycolatopsis sp. NPDC003676]